MIIRKHFNLPVKISTAVFIILVVGLAGCRQGIPPVTQETQVATLQPVIPTALSDPEQVVEQEMEQPAIQVPEPERQPRTLPLAGIQLKPFSAATFESAKAAGAYWTRRDVSWNAVEPFPGERRWEARAEFSQGIAEASQAGFEVIGIIGTTPPWARKPAFNCGAIAPQHLEHFAQTAAEIISYYHAPPYNITYWELYNEPDVHNFLGCWGDPSDNEYFGGAYYAEMLKVAYPVIKAAVPTAEILVGGLLLDCDPTNPPVFNEQAKDCTPSRFLEGILEAGAGPYFDGVAFHAYDFYAGPGRYGNANWHAAWNTTGPVQGVKAAYIRSLLDRPDYNTSGKYLINTEIALICDTCAADVDFEQAKASYVVDAYLQGMDIDLLGIVWYNLLGWRNSHLVRSNFEPLDAYHAFQFAINTIGLDVPTPLASLAWAGSQINRDDFRGYEVTHGNLRLWVIRAINDETFTLELDQAPSRVYDQTGLAVDTELPLEIGPGYLFIIWDE
jgi:hypothetical protein